VRYQAALHPVALPRTICYHNKASVTITSKDVTIGQEAGNNHTSPYKTPGGKMAAAEAHSSHNNSGSGYLLG